MFLFFLRLFLLICANYCIILYISSLARGCSILNRSSGWYIISPDVPVLYPFEARQTFTFFFSLPLQPVKAACTIYKYSFISPSSLDLFFYFFKYIYPYTLIPTYTCETMVLYDEIDLEDMSFDSESNTFFYPCPCGDQFQVSVDKLMDDSADMHIAACPNCGLEVSVRFEPVSNSFCIRQLEGGPIKFLVILISFFIIYRTIYTNLPVDSRKLSRFLRRFTSRPFPIASLSRSESPYLA